MNFFKMYTLTAGSFPYNTNISHILSRYGSIYVVDKGSSVEISILYQSLHSTLFNAIWNFNWCHIFYKQDVKRHQHANFIILYHLKDPLNIVYRILMSVFRLILLAELFRFLKQLKTFFHFDKLVFIVKRSIYLHHILMFLNLTYFASVTCWYRNKYT